MKLYSGEPDALMEPDFLIKPVIYNTKNACDEIPSKSIAASYVQTACKRGRDQAKARGKISLHVLLATSTAPVLHCCSAKGCSINDTSTGRTSLQGAQATLTLLAPKLLV